MFVLVVLWCAVVMPPRRRRVVEPVVVPDDVHRQLVQCGTKTGLISTIDTLSKAGLLNNTTLRSYSQHSLRRRLQVAQRTHSDANTPYGPVLQRMPLPIEALPFWEFVHPIALLYYLSTLSCAFGDIMASSVRAGIPFNIIIYIDEICPGNPLRPEKSRTLRRRFTGQ